MYDMYTCACIHQPSSIGMYEHMHVHVHMYTIFSSPLSDLITCYIRNRLEIGVPGIVLRKSMYKYHNIIVFWTSLHMYTCMCVKASYGNHHYWLLHYGVL